VSFSDKSFSSNVMLGISLNTLCKKIGQVTYEISYGGLFT